MLTVPAFLAVFIQAFFTIYTAIAVSRYEKKSMDANAALSGAAAGMLHGIQKIKLAGAEPQAFARWAHAYAAYARAEFNRPAVLQALPACVNFIGMPGSIVICYFAGRAQMTVTAYMAFSAAYGQMSAASPESAGEAAEKQTAAAVNRFFSVRQEEHGARKNAAPAHGKMIIPYAVCGKPGGGQL